MAPETRFERLVNYNVEIDSDSVKNESPRIVRVSRRLSLEALSSLPFKPSATYKTEENKVIALVDRVLRSKLFIPSWGVDNITSDEIKGSDGVYLDSIAGMETRFQLVNPDNYVEGFTPLIRFVKNGHVIKEFDSACDLSGLSLSDFEDTEMEIGVQFIPLRSSPQEIRRRWFEKYGYGSLSDGDIELFPLRDKKGRTMPWAYSLMGGLSIIRVGDVPGQEYSLERVRSKRGEIVYPIDGHSLIAVVDKKLKEIQKKSSLYQSCDTYLDGKLDKQSRVYLLSIPGLESSFLRRFPFADPRDISILIETEEHIRGGETTGPITQRTEPGEGRLSACEIKAYPGMKYDVVVMIQGVYDRGDFGMESR